jgi:hypothetical protein
VKTSLVENNDPVLKRLSDIKSYDDRVKFLEGMFEKLGEGSSRVVFKMDDKNIIKCAINERGIAQNLAEGNPRMQRSCTNDIAAVDAKGKWLIMRFTESITKERFKELTGLSFDPFFEAIHYKFNNESDNWSPPRDYEKIEKHPLFECVANLIFDMDMQIGDLAKINGWSELDGRPVLRDTGLTREIFQDMYATDSSPSSSPTPKTSS